ncbi:pyridoxamine 5'-phosphate oxidase family protein [Brachybacterium sp. EF45031]|uniref:pyridoxamine 5'-phosphate oxidase family protein n=1 Tax=Brachybacterium sillae TaxID=2810536 RepID=UPI00217D5CCE|nr:pyridoxamine 5'-phosphate oxidase family protein [Brachybacterium sillae]MCS6712531.1 pyridoxamine 5'-phosphate oxidase family protein [Brachybacterium sillae]
MTTETLSQDQVVATLRDARFVMLTTAASDGSLLAHPMVPQRVTDDADVYFFLGLEGGQVEALRGDRQVNIAVSEAGSWLSVAGRVQFVEDRELLRELWNDEASAYADGPEDPSLGLILVTTESAQFWGMPGGKASALARIVKAKVTGDRPAGGSATTEL